MGLSQRAYARHRGVSLTAVQKALRSGRITLDEDNTIDPEKADADWARNTRPVYRRNGDSPTTATAQTDSISMGNHALSPSGDTPRNGGADYQKARAVRELYTAKLAKLEYEEKEGKLVNIDEINIQHFNRARRLRDRMLMIPRRISAQVAAESDARNVEDMLETAIREALEDLSGIRHGNGDS